MKYDNIKVEIIRYPTEEDWKRCKLLALSTIGKKYVKNEIDEEWKRDILKAKHSPIRTLWFTIRMEIPYYVSTHFARHKIGVEHYVQSQRNDRQSNYDREITPQGATVIHTMEVNAEQIMFMANRRLCGMADRTTRYVMALICSNVEKTNPEFKGHLKPMCMHIKECPEMKSCGYWERINK